MLSDDVPVATLKKKPLKLIIILSIVAVLVIAITVFIFIAINNNSIENKIIGNWSYIHSNNLWGMIYIFTAEGGYVSSFMSPSILGSDDIRESGTYRVSGNTIFLQPVGKTEKTITVIGFENNYNTLIIDNGEHERAFQRHLD